MSILIDKNTRVLVQGITGKEGERACKEMLGYGTKVLAGVTPGKGGQKVAGVSVYNTVTEALTKHPSINTSLVAVPASFVKDAVFESVAAAIPLINILAEHVPVQDCAWMLAEARSKNVRIVGPSSVGIISPGLAKIGSVGSGGIDAVFKKGPIGLISKSGGMTAEIGVVLSKAGYGQSTAIGIGGDSIVGSDFVDLLLLFEKDKETKAVVIFGEVGGTYEEKIAEFIKSKKITKPIIAVIAGQFAENLPQGTVLGHAGAIVLEGRGSYTSKVSRLKKAGVVVAENLEEIPPHLDRILKKRVK